MSVSDGKCQWFNLFSCVGERNYIALGVCDKSYPSHLLPGWEETSVAFHMDEGMLFNSSDNATPLYQACQNGDTVKCSVAICSEHTNQIEVRFYRNDKRITSLTTRLPRNGFYGIIGMMSKGEKISLSPPVTTTQLGFSTLWEISTPHMITHIGNGICAYSGPGNFVDDSIGTVRQKQAFDPTGAITNRSFEVKIIEPGEHRYIAIGIVSQSYPANMLPGWENTSVGYHADNGSLFHSCEDGQPTDHPCKKGDVMRCTVEAIDGSSKQVKVMFHKNEILVGQVTAWTPQSGFFFCFGMMSRKEKVQVLLPEITTPYTTPKVQFDDLWQLMSPNMEHKGEGVCHYVGKGGVEHVGSIRSRLPLNPFSTDNTFEVKVINPGENCYIALGVCSLDYPTMKLPGWEELSVGFHTDEGIIHSSEGEKATNLKCRQGDVVRCSIEPVDGSDKQVHVFFHRNGVLGDKAIFWKPKEGGILAQISCMSRGEVVQIASPRMEPSSLNADLPAFRGPERFSSIPDVYTQEPVPPFRKVLSQPMMDPVVEAAQGRDHPGAEPIPKAVSEGHMVASHPPLFPQFPSQPTTEQIEWFRRVYMHKNTMWQEMYHRLFQHPYPGHQYDPHHHELLPNDPHLMSLHMQPGSQAPHKSFHSGDTLPPFGELSKSYPPPADKPQLVPQMSEPLGHTPPVYAEQVSVASSASDTSALDFADQGEQLKTPSKGASVISANNDTPPTKSISPLSLARYDAPSNTSTKEDKLTPSKTTSAKPLYDDEPQRIQNEKSGNDQVTIPPGELERIPPSNEPSLSDVTTKESTKYFSGLPTLDSAELVAPGVSASLSEARRLIRQPSTTTPQEQADIVPIEDNKMFKVLHNIETTSEDNSFVCTVPAETSGNAFAIYRRPLTEKIPYFEVKIEHIGPNGNIAVGLIWDHYPVFHLPGMLQGSIALCTYNGSVYTGPDEEDCKKVTTACVAGDTIGCRALLCYKSEVNDPVRKRDENLIKIEFYKNGELLTIESVFLPPSGFFPAASFTGLHTRVTLNQNYRLNPETYFESHPLPETFSNFPNPPPLPKPGWQCLQNSLITGESNLCLHQPQTGTPGVVQSCLPFSQTDSYFEIVLNCSVRSYSVLAIGALPKALSNSKKLIPGEASTSVGFLPLLGFTMRNGGLCGTIPEVVSSALYQKNTTIGVGIIFTSPVKAKLASSTSGILEDKVTVSFTVNGQQVTSIITALPKGGLYPTLAIDSDCKPATECLAALSFPKIWPLVTGLPFGFVRGSESGYLVIDSNTVKDCPKTDSNSTAVRACQAAVPLSTSNSYYEVRIFDGGEGYHISIGVATYNYILDAHPGWNKSSLAFHADDGRFFHDGTNYTIAPPCKYRGALLGCGVRFPEDGSMKYAEVFFTVNHKMVIRKFVNVPDLGLFPTIGMRSKGAIIRVELDVPDPFPDLTFSTVFTHKQNMNVEGCLVQSIDQAEFASVHLLSSYNSNSLLYYTVTPHTEKNGMIMLGVSSIKPGEFNTAEVDDEMACHLNIISGKVTTYDKYFQSKETCAAKDSAVFGCGLCLLPPGNTALLFFTADDQVIFCSKIELKSKEIYPCINLFHSNTCLLVDACALWPKPSTIGYGWGRHANIKLENQLLKHSAVKKKPPVGFAQVAMPLTPSDSYFEVEVCSRAQNKAIAVGLASRRYPINSWVGWYQHSIAYHLDDGKLFNTSNLGHSFGPKVYSGDTVGCGIRFIRLSHSFAVRGGDKVEVFFTINGAVLGTRKVDIPCGGFFPTICLESPTESIIFNRYKEFPPVSTLVDTRDWSRAYSVCQADRQIRHCGKHRDLHGGKPKGFCQAKDPFSSENPYFEIEIIGTGDHSQIQIGAAVLFPRNCISPNTHSMLYNHSGQVVTRRGVQKYSTSSQKCGLGDCVGCAVIFTEDSPPSVEFYVNKVRVHLSQVPEEWQQQDLYPTIVLTSPRDSVIPLLRQPLPQWSHANLVGWLRSERMRLRNNIVEYTAPGKTITDVGVAQISQCLKLDTNSYYEVEVLHPGTRCTISIGAASADYSLSLQPGWAKNSIALHGDDGRMFQVSELGCPFGPKWKKNDIIGLGIRSVSGDLKPGSEVQVYFVHNGIELGHTTVNVPHGGLFPTIGMHSLSEKVKVELNVTPSFSCKYFTSWRSLCGIHIQKVPSDDETHVLSYRKRGRVCDPKINTYLLSVAVAAQSFSETIQYFEVEIMSVGPMGVAVGVVPVNYPLDQATGWANDSLAYHTDDGALYSASIVGREFGPVPHKGDVIGCGINMVPNSSRHCSIFFTYNGMEFGRTRHVLPQGGLFPSVTLTHTSDKVAIRFKETFKTKGRPVVPCQPCRRADAYSQLLILKSDHTVHWCRYQQLLSGSSLCSVFSFS